MTFPSNLMEDEHEWTFVLQDLITNLLGQLPSYRGHSLPEGSGAEQARHRLEGAELALWAARYCEPLPIDLAPHEPPLSVDEMEDSSRSDSWIEHHVGSLSQSIEQTAAAFDDAGWFARGAWEDRATGAEAALSCLVLYCDAGPETLPDITEHLFESVLQAQSALDHRVTVLPLPIEEAR